MIDRMINESVAKVTVSAFALVAIAVGSAWSGGGTEASIAEAAGHITLSDVIAIGAIILQVVFAFRDIQTMKKRLDKIEAFLEADLPKNYLSRELADLSYVRARAHDHR